MSREASSGPIWVVLGLQLFFISLKISNFITWSWVTVFLPLIIVVSLLLGFYVGKKDNDFHEI